MSRSLCVSVSARYCIPQCVRLIAGVCVCACVRTCVRACVGGSHVANHTYCIVPLILVLVTVTM